MDTLHSFQCLFSVCPLARVFVFCYSCDLFCGSWALLFTVVEASAVLSSSGWIVFSFLSCLYL